MLEESLFSSSVSIGEYAVASLQFRRWSAAAGSDGAWLVFPFPLALVLVLVLVLALDLLPSPVSTSGELSVSSLLSAPGALIEEDDCPRIAVLPEAGEGRGSSPRICTRGPPIVSHKSDIE